MNAVVVVNSCYVLLFVAVARGDDAISVDISVVVDVAHAASPSVAIVVASVPFPGVDGATGVAHAVAAAVDDFLVAK